MPREPARPPPPLHLIAHDILPIYARTVVIEGSPEGHPSRALLLVGEKKHEAAFRLRQRLAPRARVLMGSLQALQLADGRLIAHATPFTDRYPWEDKPAESTPAPSCASFASSRSQGGSPGLTSAEITRIIILPADVSFLSSQALDPESLFCPEPPVLGASAAEPKPDPLFSEGTSPDLLPSLIKSLVLPEGLQLRLKALSLAGEIAKLF